MSKKSSSSAKGSPNSSAEPKDLWVAQDAASVEAPPARTKYPWSDYSVGQTVVVPKVAVTSARNYMGAKVREAALNDAYSRIWFEAEPGEVAPSSAPSDTE